MEHVCLFVYFSCSPWLFFFPTLPKLLSAHVERKSFFSRNEFVLSLLAHVTLQLQAQAASFGIVLRCLSSGENCRGLGPGFRVWGHSGFRVEGL